MSQEQDRIFFRNYSIVIGILVVMILVFLVLARMFGMDEDAETVRRADQVAETTKPVGEVRVAGAEEPAGETASIEPTAAAAAPAAEASVPDLGKQTYSGLCFSCHGTGLPGIPQFGDKEAWAPRIAQGAETLYDRALKGFTGSSGIMMPAKGGNPALSDDAVKAAVDYMVANAR